MKSNCKVLTSQDFITPIRFYPFYVTCKSSQCSLGWDSPKATAHVTACRHLAVLVHRKA